MKKKLLILPILAALLVACTGDELVVIENSGQETKEDGAIAFDAYLNRTVTRAGLVGGITTTELQSAGGGFGVFAYYTDGDIYSDNAIPNFMYNQEVKYNGSTENWTYSPIKYWPNEFGTSAVSMGVDRVTFFAYAPYVGVDPSTGLLTDYYDDSYDDSEPARSPNTGITALTRNGKTGDPYVRYVGAFDPAKCVDLCYGVAADKFISSLDAYDGANNINAGDPYINVAKPAVGSKLKFNFKHALVQLNVNVDADVDIVGHDEGDVRDGKTRVWVRSVTFDGVSQRGYLNMNTGVWYETIDNNKISHASVTVHDGRRDGAEALADDSYETPIGLNPQLVQSAAYTTTPGTNVNGAPKYDIGADFSTTSGVTATPQPLFGETSHDLLVIPANEQLRVTIVYDVETADATLPKFLSDGTTRGSTIENKIVKNITVNSLPLKLEAGKAYSISLHLGMTSVSFSATVSDWGAGGTSDVDLPKNGPQFAAVESASLTTYPVTVSAEAQTYQFAITGLNSGESVTGPADAGNFTGATSNAANTAGDAVESVSIAANNTVRNIAATDLTWTGGTSSKKVVLSIKQLAHKLGLKVGSDNTFTAGTTIALTSTASGIGSDWLAETTDATPVPGSITVLKNGSPMTKVDSSPSDLQFSYNATSGGITLGTEAAVGDIFTITLKTGDAPAETISVKAVAAP